MNKVVGENVRPILLRGAEAKRVLWNIKHPNFSFEYRKILQERVAFYRRVKRETEEGVGGGT